MRLRAAESAALPCAALRYSPRLRRSLRLRPAVDCGFACAACPWNRAEQRRRLAEGVWRRGKDGLLRLCFRPAAPEAALQRARREEAMPCPAR